MTFFQFAAEHGGLAAFFAAAALAAVVVPVWLVTRYLRERLPEMSAEDRTAPTKAASRLRHTACVYGGDGHIATRDAMREEAEALERMAAR